MIRALESRLRRQCLCATGAALSLAFTAPGFAQSAASERAPPTTPLGSAHFVARTREAWAARRPLVLMFALHGCPWCDALRRDQIVHLAREAPDQGLLVLELDLLDERPFGADPLPGIWADSSSPKAWAQRMRVRTAPTVLFLGPEGELAPRLVGYSSPDFYGAYLQARIDTARRRIRPA